MIDPSDSSLVAVLSGTIILLGVVPSLIAFIRNHRRRRAILVLNLLTGWTGIGWVIAAVWSSTANIEPRGALPGRVLPPKKPPERHMGTTVRASASPMQAANAPQPARESYARGSRS